MENVQRDDIHQSFASINAGRAAAAERLVTPPWYHPVLGLMVGSYMVVLTLGNTVAIAVTIVLYFVGIPLLISAYKKQTGVWVWGFGAGRASRWTYLLGALVVVCAAAMFYSHSVVGIDWPVWLLGVAIVVIVILVGRRFDVAVRSQLRAALDSPAEVEDPR